jgi:hypothetical protein
VSAAAEISCDSAVRARRAFAEIGPDNPLKHLEPPDRELLWALLLFYERVSKQINDMGDPWEEVSTVAAEAKKLSSQMNDTLFQGPIAQMLAPFTAEYRSLPAQLAACAKLLTGLLDLQGKPGHKWIAFSNQILVIASEVVRRQTGSYYDEHVAELFQAIATAPATESLSGAAIAKKRKRLSTSYPELYSLALDSAARMCQSNVPSIAERQ